MHCRKCILENFAPPLELFAPPPGGRAPQFEYRCPNLLNNTWLISFYVIYIMNNNCAKFHSNTFINGSILQFYFVAGFQWNLYGFFINMPKEHF